MKKESLPDLLRRVLFSRVETRKMVIEYEDIETGIVSDTQRILERFETFYKAERSKISKVGPRGRQITLFMDEPLKIPLTGDDYLECLHGHSFRDLPVGKTDDGDLYSFDWVETPHIMLGGTTGAGKSVALNTIISATMTGIEKGNVILIDPKGTELGIWASVGAEFSTGDEMVATLDRCVYLMESRYRWMADRGTQNLWTDTAAMRELGGPVVVVVDELKDLLDTGGKAAGVPLGRLAQKARGAGIFLLLATQTPSAEMFSAGNGSKGLRELIGMAFALRVARSETSKMILGVGADVGDSSKIPSSREMKGTAVLPTGDWMRFPFLEDRHIEQVKARIGQRPTLDELLPDIEAVRNE